jgi:hypothetical protein
VGYRKRADAPSSANIASRTGAIKPIVLPLAVGVTWSTFNPSRAYEIASAWWLNRRVTPAWDSADATGSANGGFNSP